MNILCDRHHDGLWNSLILLFEKRLGHTLYHPWGMEWFDSGNWLIGNPYGASARNTATQFLNEGVPTDGTAIIRPTRGIDFETFKNTPIDIIIASYYDHIPVYTKLRDQYHPNAKVIAQYGNEWPIHPEIKNLLASTAPMNVPPHINVCYYHQNIDEDNYYHFYDPEKVNSKRKITSFVNAMPQNTIFQEDWEDFLQLELRLPEYEFQSHGGGCRDGSLSQKDVANNMRESKFIVNFKTGGDGFSHVIHSGFSCGVPFIYKGSQYKGKLAGELLSHLETGIDIEKIGFDGIIPYIYSLSEGEYKKYRYNVRKRFEEKVNYNQEEILVKKFIENLI